MLLTLKEVVYLLGMTVFELWIYIISFIIFTIFLTLKLEQVWDISWWVIFTPLFTCNGLHAYFATIVFIRLYLDQDLRVAALRLLWSGLLVALIFIFQILLCKKLEGEIDIADPKIMTVLFFLLHVIIFHTCQVP